LSGGSFRVPPEGAVRNAGCGFVTMNEQSARNQSTTA